MRPIAFTLTVGAIWACSAAGAFAQSGVRSAGDLDWKPAPADLPRGAEIATLFGDPARSGAFVVRLRARAGYQVPAHKHPDTETLTVISGTLRYGEGRRLDPAAEKFIHAGDFVAAPAETGHWIVVNDDAVIQIMGDGPWRIHYLDPRDEPRAASQEGALR
jgi:quercetin dioxygenase-like cupin family protein